MADAKHFIVHSDGGSRGNPGEAACAAVVFAADGNELLTRAARIGVATNNVAEYRGVIMALDLCQELGAASVLLRIDSELIERQMRGVYRVKHPDLKPLYQRAMILARGFTKFKVEHVRREENARADELVNEVLDGKEADA